MPKSRSVLVVEPDPATHSLIGEWLDAEGWQLLDDHEPARADPPSLILLDLPYPREGGLKVLDDTRVRHPGVPVLVMSPTFFASVGCCGPCAESLGVAGVLPKPVAREALLDAVRRLARPAH